VKILAEDLIIYHIQKGELVPIKEPKFNTGDSYVIDLGNTIWIWIGKTSQVDEKFIAAKTAQDLDVERRGRPRVDSCFEGEEDQELLDALGPDFKVVEGDTPSMLVHVDTSFKPMFKMIRVKQEGSTISYDELPFSRDTLDSNDVFVVAALMGEEAQMIYTWIGKDARPMEKFKAAIRSDLIDKEFREAPQTITIEEGQETGGFNFVFKAYKDFKNK
jgi:advillin